MRRHQRCTLHKLAALSSSAKDHGAPRLAPDLPAPCDLSLMGWHHPSHDVTTPLPHGRTHTITPYTAMGRIRIKVRRRHLLSDRYRYPGQSCSRVRFMCCDWGSTGLRPPSARNVLDGVSVCGRLLLYNSEPILGLPLTELS